MLQVIAYSATGIVLLVAIVLPERMRGVGVFRIQPTLWVTIPVQLVSHTMYYTSCLVTTCYIANANETHPARMRAWFA